MGLLILLCCDDLDVTVLLVPSGDLPLPDDVRGHLRRIKAHLARSLEPRSLLPFLVTARIIDEIDYEAIEAETSSCKKMLMIVDVLIRGSKGHLAAFKSILRHPDINRTDAIAIIEGGM